MRTDHGSGNKYRGLPSQEKRISVKEGFVRKLAEAKILRLPVNPKPPSSAAPKPEASSQAPKAKILVLPTPIRED